MLLAGFATILFAQKGIAPDSPEADESLKNLGASILSALSGALAIRPAAVWGIYGWRAQVDLPHVHEHRSIGEIRQIIGEAAISENARARALACFGLLAECEAAAHGIAPEEVHFHEVGALDSLLDICGACELYSQLGEPMLVASSLPVADGAIHCAHGVLPAPAPATLRLLNGIPLRPFAGDVCAGELLTPTGVALLRALEASFGPWPDFTLKSSSLVYGQRVFANVPNGLIFAYGNATRRHE